MDELKIFLSQPTTDIISKIKSNEAHIIYQQYEYFITAKFRAGQTGCSRKDLNIWKNEGLLPYAAEDTGWNCFSIVECVWLRFISMLKKFGVENENIRQIKNQMFSTDPTVLRECFSNKKDMPYLPKEITDSLSDIWEMLGKIPASDLESDLKKIHFSFFGLTVMLCCNLHLNYAVIINEDADYMILNIGEPFNKNLWISLSELMKPLSNRSFLLINIYQLCKDFFDNENVMIDSGFYWGLMNDFEQRVITEVRSGKYKMVTVKIDNGSITHIKLTKTDNENEEMLRKISRLFKTNDFKDIELTTRNGDIVKFSETDIIKMNKK